MAPIFRQSSFEFSQADQVPEHVEADPVAGERDLSKIWLQGEDTFSGEGYPVAVDIEDFRTATILRAARLRQLETTQPTAESGGQSYDGVQDRVYIRMPLDSRAEYFRQSPKTTGIGQLIANATVNLN